MCKSDVYLRSNAGEMRPIHFNGKDGHSCLTVFDLKELAVKVFPRSAPTSKDLRLIVLNQPLENDKDTLCKYGITPETVVQMVRKVNGG